MIINLSNARHYRWGDGCDGWHLLEADGLSIIRERAPAGASEQRHVHRRARQFFYILRGSATMEINGIRYDVCAGQGIEVPPNTPHQFLNHTGEDVEFLVISSPESHGDRIDL